MKIKLVVALIAGVACAVLWGSPDHLLPGVGSVCCVVVEWPGMVDRSA